MGDGPAIMSHWKFDLLQFWNKSHPKYLILAYQMLAGKTCQACLHLALCFILCERLTFFPKFIGL